MIRKSPASSLKYQPFSMTPQISRPTKRTTSPMMAMSRGWNLDSSRALWSSWSAPMSTP